MKKRILFVNHSSHLTGGANDDFERLLKYYSSHKDKYIICGLSPKGPNEDVFKKYCDEWNSYTSGFFPVTTSNVLDYLGFIKAYFYQKKEIKKILKDKKYDLCVINVVVLFWITFWLWRKKFKLLIFIRENIQPRYLKKIIYSFMNRFGNYFIAVSDSLENDFIEITGNRKVKTIYSAIESDLDYFQFSEKFLENIRIDNYEEIILNNDPKFICVGSICDRKNQLLILETAKLLKSEGRSVYFLFVGEISDPVYYDKLIEFCNKFDLTSNCIFLGQKDKNYIYNLYKYVKCMIISSKSEGLPLVLVESLFFKIPLITTDAGGIHDVIKDNYNGILIERNKEELLDAIVRILEDNELFRKLTEKGYETFINKFNLEKNLLYLNSITDKLINGEL